MKKLISLLLTVIMVLVGFTFMNSTIGQINDDDETPEDPQPEAEASEERSARQHYEPSDFADHNVYFFISPNSAPQSTDHYLAGAPRISDGGNQSRNKAHVVMGTSNSVEFFYPRRGSKLYELTKNETFDKKRRPYLNLTINSLDNDAKLVQVQVQIDTDGDGNEDAFLDYPPYLTTGNNADGTQEEEIYEAEGTWQGGTSPANIKGSIKVVVWHTNQDGEDMILYCGFDYKLSWIALPFNHKDLIPIAIAGPRQGFEPDPRILVGDLVYFFGNNSFDPNDDLNGNGVIEPSLGEFDNLRYKWVWGDNTETSFQTGLSRPSHIYTKEKIPKGEMFKIFNVHLIVQDPEGHTDDNWTWVKVFRGNHTPVIESMMINGLDQLFKTPSSPLEQVVFYQDVQFSAIASDVDDDDLTYHWDLDGDDKFDEEGGEEGEEAATQVSFIYNPLYNDPGLVEVTLVVSDGTPETENASFSINITLLKNKKPTPLIYAQKDGDSNMYYNSIVIHTNQKIIFNGIDSYDPDNLPGFDIDEDFAPDYSLRYKWYFDYAYDQSATSGWLNTEEVSYIYPVANSEFRYVVILEVDDGLATNRSGNFTVYMNVPPVPKAYIDESSYSKRGLLETNSTIQFIGDESHDPNGDEINFTWDFGDKSPKSHAVNPTHVYDSKGLYTVKLSLSDGDFVTQPFKLPVDVKQKPLPPVAVPRFSTIQTYSLTDIWFDGVWSYDPDGYHYNPKDPMTYQDDIVKYYWDFGDGNFSNEMNTTHAYAKKGYYKIFLTVWDKADIKDTNTQFAIEIMNRPPIAHPGTNRKVKENQNIIFSGDRSDDADGDVVSYLWDFGDGSVPIWTNDTKINHSFAQAGAFHVTLQVKDNNGGVSNASSVSVKVSGKSSGESDIGDLLLLIAIIAIIIVIVAVIAAIIWIRSREAI